MRKKSLSGRGAVTILFGVLAGACVYSAADARIFAYIGNNGDNTVSVVDIATSQVVGSLGVGAGPVGIAAAPDGGHLYVADNGANAVSVIDTASNLNVATVPVGSGPQRLAVTPDGTTLYVANLGSGTVSAVDTASNSLVATIPVNASPLGLAISPDGRKVYAGAYGGGGNVVAVIDTSTNTLENPIFGCGVDYQLALSNDGSLLYEACPYTAQYIVDTTTGNVTATAPIPGNALAVAIAPHANEAWYSLYDGTHNASLNAVAVVDTITNAVKAVIPVGVQPQYIAFLPDGRFAYAVDEASKSVAVIDAKSLSVVGTISVGNLPIGIAITHVAHSCTN